MVGVCVKRWERLTLSKKQDVVANNTFMTTSRVVHQNGTVIVPDEVTCVLFNELAKRQDGWAPFRKEIPRVGIESRELVIHLIGGGSWAARNGHTDHGSVTPNGCAKLVGKALLAR